MKPAPGPGLMAREGPGSGGQGKNDLLGLGGME
jgi:hypothetical protein